MGRVGKTAVALVVCLLVSASYLPALPALTAPPVPQAKPNTRLFGTQDLGLLEAPDRELWQKPDQIMDAIGVAEGAVVAELGAAGG